MSVRRREEKRNAVCVNNGRYRAFNRKEIPTHATARVTRDTRCQANEPDTEGQALYGADRMRT